VSAAVDVTAGGRLGWGSAFVWALLTDGKNFLVASGPVLASSGAVLHGLALSCAVLRPLVLSAPRGPDIRMCPTCCADDRGPFGRVGRAAISLRSPDRRAVRPAILTTRQAGRNGRGVCARVGRNPPGRAGMLRPTLEDALRRRRDARGRSLTPGTQGLTGLSVLGHGQGAVPGSCGEQERHHSRPSRTRAARLAVAPPWALTGNLRATVLHHRLARTLISPRSAIYGDSASHSSCHPAISRPEPCQPMPPLIDAIPPGAPSTPSPV
jgi:hypothetical protein